jgi:methyl-accepting chemotaxis protein
MNSISRKITLIAAAAIVLTTIVMLLITTVNQYDNTVAAAGKHAVTGCTAVSAFIDGDLCETIIKNGGVIPPELQAAYDKEDAALDRALQELEKDDAVYLYIMTPSDSEGMTHYYISAADRDGKIDFWTEEPLDVFDPEMVDVMRDGVTFAGGIYDSGDYGDLLTGYVPVFNSAGEPVAAVGMDYSVDLVMGETLLFMLRNLLWAALLIVVEAILISVIFKRTVTSRITEVTTLAHRIADGETSISVSPDSGRDEISELKNAFMKLSEGTHIQAEAIEKVAAGDLKTDITLLSDRDSLGIAVNDLQKRLRDLIRQLNLSVASINTNATTLDSSSDILESNTDSEQSALSALSETAEILLKSIDAAAAKAESAARSELKMLDVTANGQEKIRELSKAVADIKDSNAQITSVIKVINDIAFQTNILALNASVEAARAGEHGKGFAVVAGEVRNLASKSGQAADDTAHLISESSQKADAGVTICTETEQYFAGITDSVRANNEEIEALSVEIRNLSATIAAISSDAEQIHAKARDNADHAKRISGMSAEMKNMAEELEKEADIFKLD